MVKDFRYYTTAEIARIRGLAATGKSAREIGEIVGRTHRAIGWTCQQHGIKLTGSRRGNPTPTRSKDRWKNPYTPEDLAKLRRLAPTHSMSQLAEKLGRSLGSISGTCFYYRIETGGGPGGSPSHKHSPSPIETPVEENA